MIKTDFHCNRVISFYLKEEIKVVDLQVAGLVPLSHNCSYIYKPLGQVWAFVIVAVIIQVLSAKTASKVKQVFYSM